MARASVCVLLSLALVGAAVPLNDECSLVQSHRDIASQGHAALNPNSPELHPELLAKLRSFSKQIPFEMPGFMANFSMEQMMNVGMEFLSLFKNQTIVDVMEEGWHNVTTGLLAYSKKLDSAASEVRADAMNATSKAKVLEALLGYMKGQNFEFSVMVADLVVDSRKFGRMLPAGGALSNMTEPMLQMENVTKSQVSGLVLLVLSNPTEEIFDNESTFCDKFKPFYGNYSLVADFLTKKSDGMMDSMKEMLPQVMPMLEGFAPDVAPKVSAMLNKTMDDMDEILAAFRVSLPHAVGALAEVAEGRLGCSLGSPTQSGAAPLVGAPRSFGLVAAAAAMAWLLAA